VVNLKKQSQFSNAKMSATSILTKDYENTLSRRAAKNEADQSQRLADGDSVQKAADS
jgi:hypothetical protein